PSETPPATRQESTVAPAPAEVAVPAPAVSSLAQADFSTVDGVYREFEGSPALALSFSEPLDPKKDYGSFVQVLEMKRFQHTSGDDESSTRKEESEKSTLRGQSLSLEDGTPVSGAWAVGENPRMLFFSNIKPRTRYLVRVQADLPAKDARKLGAEERFSIQTPSVNPAYYFASRGTVLPASRNGGLPVVTVNVPEVDIQFLKVKSDQLPNFFDRVLASRSGIYEDEGSTRMKGVVNVWDMAYFEGMTESVFIGRFLTDQKVDRRSVTYIPVETLPALRNPGVYIAMMSRPNQFHTDYQVTYFYVSDLGLHVRQHGDASADVFVSSLTTGKGVSGVEVTWNDNDARVLALAETDGDGHASFKERPTDARVVIAKKGEQISLIALREPALDLAEFDVGGIVSAPVRLFAWSGRDLYRPGESFDVSVLARGADGQKVETQPIQAVLRRPDGKMQWTETWRPDEAFTGYYRRKIELPIDAATGFWNLELRTDPAAKLASAVMRIGVEEFLPERMTLDLASEKSLLGANDTSDFWNIGVTGRYLYGAPAGGNRLLGVVNAERAKNPLEKKLPGFIFGDANEDSERVYTELDETKLDSQGRTSVGVTLSDVEKRLSPFSIRATISLLESGGRPVVRSIERVWWPAPVLLGLRPLFEGAYAREGSNVEFEIARADTSGNLHAAQALPIRLFNEDRQYYWRFEDGRGWHSGFTETDELVLTTQVAIPAGGRGKFSVPVKYGRYRVEALDPETGLMTRYRFYAGWSAQESETQGIRPDRVALKLDKPVYADGETAKLTVRPPHAGEALITLEGGGLLWKKRLTIGADGTVVDVPLRAEWKRHDLYVTAMVLRPSGAPARAEDGKVAADVTPARALGVIHLPLDRSARKIAVALEAPKKMEPELPLKVKVKAPGARGQKALLTLSAVDVGILNITRFASPDPFGFYFGKLRYADDLYDIYGRLIEKTAGLRGKLKWGGDAATLKSSKDMPKKVRLVDLFSGPVQLDANGEADVTLNVPDFNGTLRLMAVVASEDHFGMQEAEVVIAAPLIVELNMPRFLSVGDSALLALDVQNLSGTTQAIGIRVANDEGLKIRDGAQKLTLKDQEKKILRIPLEAGSALGLTEVRIDVDSPRKKFSRTFPIQVQSPTPRQTVVKSYIVEPGNMLTISDATLGGFTRHSVTATLAVSNKPPIDVRSAVQGLLTYPYGCAEQTTSTAYPHVFIDEENARYYGLAAFSLAQRAEMLNKAIARLSGMQAPSGGFSLWGNASEYQYWLTAYIAHFLLDAREQGFSVPEKMEKNAVDFLLRGLQEGAARLPRNPGAIQWNSSVWRDTRYAGPGMFGVLSYGAYVLARHGKAPLSTLRQIYESKGAAYSGLSLVQLGLALHLSGDEARAKEAVEEGVIKTRNDNRWWGDYGSDLRDRALSYVLMQKHDMKPAGRENLVLQVAAALRDKRYLSTQEKLAVFLLGQSFRAYGKDEWSAQILRKGKAETLTAPYLSVRADEIADGLHLRNIHADRLFAQLNYSGNPEKMPPVKNDVFVLKRDWRQADGSPLPARPLRVGETLLVRLRVEMRSHVANALVVDHIPAGVEIENANIVQGARNSLVIEGVDVADAMRNSNIKHVEFRDDRFVASLNGSGRFYLFYRVRVVTPGQFVVPSTYAEDMYQPAIYGLSAPEGNITIVDSAQK
ncbi:MAG: alpha-2-macroglobulin family protein, partial [Candidatus Accumulibacter sp.]|nr:alpha-2-macroglobulin family protein [Accumulibacter sp.]